MMDPNDIADFEAFVAGQIDGWCEPERSDLEQYLRAQPGRSVRDWKAKASPCPAPMEPGELAWARLHVSDVREAATQNVARELPRSVRQAAGRDRGLIWNQLAAKYRLREPTDPPAAPENSLA